MGAPLVGRGTRGFAQPAVVGALCRRFAASGVCPSAARRRVSRFVSHDVSAAARPSGRAASGGGCADIRRIPSPNCGATGPNQVGTWDITYLEDAGSGSLLLLICGDGYLQPLWRRLDACRAGMSVPGAHVVARNLAQIQHRAWSTHPPCRSGSADEEQTGRATVAFVAGEPKGVECKQHCTNCFGAGCLL